jgi:hypothetical protein
MGAIMFLQSYLWELKATMRQGVIFAVCKAIIW